ncbi:MAG: acetyl-CoA carboxylase biotin carboxylase subunit [Chloroflexi bacterium]|nr:acetyl-CoA carboxylase biotin carboxylase subunit [Chloroflexota bacterium]
MFRKILIANRGEIACRVIRTCRKMGIATVAVYSDVDAPKLHVRMADEAVRIGSPPASESYLNIPRIIEAAQRSGAEAVHPGYGFLSQNPHFARACQEAGLAFIGPRPEVMERMGDKVMARHLAREAGLPVVPGTDNAVTDRQALAAARELGFPVMLKAAAGGGGIGIRVATSLDELRQVLKRARTLARGAFGSGELYVEKYVPNAAHVEVQVLGDQHGRLVHLFERDCSVQRRNQKIIEETPCVKITPQQRDALCSAALALAHHIEYTNAGTVEFLLDPEGRFYFLEMNTRLQVEHGVTEMVMGLDMVELQVRIAAGEPLPFTQADVACRGHAIEARVYPEDPDTFLPMSGVVRRVEEPSGPGVRVDSSLYPGLEVTTHYDPLLAKVIVWGETRGEAIQRLTGAVRSLVVEGVKTNTPTLRAVLGDPTFILGNYTTQLLSQVAARPRRWLAGPTAMVSTNSEAVVHDAVRRHLWSRNGASGSQAQHLVAVVAAAISMAASWPELARDEGARWRREGRRLQMQARLGVRPI